MFYKLKDYKNEDYNFIYDIKKISYKKYVEEYYGEWIEKQQLEMFDKYLSMSAKNIKLIEVQGETIGFLEGFENLSGEYEIGNICILPKFQGQGIGSVILKDILFKYKNKNVYLRVFKSNPAQNLYKRLGFEIIEETRTHFNMIKHG